MGSEVWCVKYPGGIYGKAGTPDLILSVQGRFVALEVKTPEGVQTPLQIREATKILDSGGACFCVSSLKQVQFILRNMLRKR